MDLSFQGLKDDYKAAVNWVSEGDHKYLAAGAAVVGIGAAAILTRGRSLPGEAKVASGILPELGLGLESTATKQALLGTPYPQELIRASLRKQTFAEMATEKTVKTGCQTAKAIVSALKGKEVGEMPAVVSDDVRRHVFNRFLSRIDQERYVLHGSYPLEAQSFVARKATKDLDLLVLDKSLLKGTKAETNKALIADLRQMAGKDTGDGLTFEIPELTKDPVHLVWPRMRHAMAIAKVGDQELMRVPLDLRIGAGTILPPTKQVLKGAAGEAPTVFGTMQPEETIAHKLFSYTNRTAGGLERKPKDLSDIASIIKSGVDEEKVTEAMRGFTAKGYTLGAMRHPSQILGKSLTRRPDLLVGQTPTQLDENFQLVRNFYERIAPKVVSTPLRDDVSTKLGARLLRFAQKQLTVYPAG